MAIGDLVTVPGRPDLHYVDAGFFGVPGYGSVYLLDAERPAVIDPGIGRNLDLVLEGMDAVGIDEPAVVLTTHVHLDHAGAAGRLVERFPDATVLTHEIGVPHLIDPGRLIAGTKAAVGDEWAYYVEPTPVPEGRIESIEDGDEIDLGDRTLDAIHAPGHAPHQVVFHDRRDDALFAGDAAGIYPPGADEPFPSSPPANFDLAGCLDDAATIADRDPDVLCFAHFGAVDFEPALMDAYRRVLADWVARVREKRAALGDDEAVIEQFVETAEPIEPWGARKIRDEYRLNVRGVLGYLDAQE
jgi:glyoxylase-like metal-dependent hydrolase (beta-lactamase superfamily II)